WPHCLNAVRPASYVPRRQGSGKARTSCGVGMREQQNAHPEWALQHTGPAFKPIMVLAARPAPATARRQTNRHFVDVTVHALLDPEGLAGRDARVIGPESRIKPGEVVEDADGTDGFVDDEAAAAGLDRLREGAHGAGLPLRVPGTRVDAPFKPGTRRAVWYGKIGGSPVVDVGLGRGLQDTTAIALVFRDLAPVFRPRLGKVLVGAEHPVILVSHHGLHDRDLAVLGHFHAGMDHVGM